MSKLLSRLVNEMWDIHEDHKSDPDSWKFRLWRYDATEDLKREYGEKVADEFEKILSSTPDPYNVVDHKNEIHEVKHLGAFRILLLRAIDFLVRLAKRTDQIYVDDHQYLVCDLENLKLGYKGKSIRMYRKSDKLLLLEALARGRNNYCFLADVFNSVRRAPENDIEETIKGLKKQLERLGVGKSDIRDILKIEGKKIYCSGFLKFQNGKYPPK
ncbi:MAG: hypothetical protein NTZ80_00220 [Patescibacteria group bacterium]|nr:hypothetical protein [Patescibacteria group bacterium]